MILEETMVSSHWDNLIYLCCKYKLQVIFLFHLSELESNEQQREVSDGGVRDGKEILQTYFFETKNSESLINLYFWQGSREH